MGMTLGKVATEGNGSWDNELVASSWCPAASSAGQLFPAEEPSTESSFTTFNSDQLLSRFFYDSWQMPSSYMTREGLLDLRVRSLLHGIPCYQHSGSNSLPCNLFAHLSFMPQRENIPFLLFALVSHL